MFASIPSHELGDRLVKANADLSNDPLSVSQLFKMRRLLGLRFQNVSRDGL
jgi:hypothetical protein